MDVTQASAGNWLAQKVSWHLLGRRPVRMSEFSRQVIAYCAAKRPEMLLSTGFAPLDATTLKEIGGLGVYRVNYLTDDPWNPALAAPWFLCAVREYDEVFSTRRANIDQLRSAGCQRVDYLPFAFAPHVHFATPLPESHRRELESDVIFAGGGDADRVPYIAALAENGLRIALYGGYWDRFPATRPLAQGLKSPAFLRDAIGAAKIALCLVRRANRDGQCMRTFEVPAIGACMLVEKTDEHVEIFGEDGRAVAYFSSIPEMTEKANWLIAHEDERRRLRDAAYRLMQEGGHRYQDRLLSILESARVSRV
jgi:hypothetical protein